MLKSQPLFLLLFASGVAFASSACADGGETRTPIKLDPTGGTGGSGDVGGTGTGGSGLVSTGGTPATGGTGTGGTDVTGGTGGTDVTGGTGGIGVTGGTGGSGVTGGTGGSDVTGGTGGSGVTGGTGGSGVTGGTGGSGVTGGTGGSGGTGGAGGGAGGAANMIVLYDGSTASFNNWTAVRNGGANPWMNNGDGTMTVRSNTGDILSKQMFQNVFVHLEYVTPRIVSAPADEQQRGNSGVYLKASYETQILDTFGLGPSTDRCGAIYGIAAPLVVACNQAETWNTYEIDFRAQTCNGTTKTASAVFVEVKLNNQVVHRNVTVNRTTEAGQAETCSPKGLMLQDHGTVVPVSFRNIWVIPR